MTDRYTRKDAERAYERLRDALGKQETKWTRSNVDLRGNPTEARVNLGSWSLDYNPIYGGCVIEEICTDGGGITHPLGSTRSTPREFCEKVNFALRAIEIDRAARGILTLSA